MEISNLSDKEFKVMVKKMLTELGRRIDEHNENFNKEMENIRNDQTEVTELMNPVTELTNTLEEFHSRLGGAEESMISKIRHQNSSKQSSKKF